MASRKIKAEIRQSLADPNYKGNDYLIDSMISSVVWLTVIVQTSFF